MPSNSPTKYAPLLLAHGNTDYNRRSWPTHGLGTGTRALLCTLTFMFMFMVTFTFIRQASDLMLSLVCLVAAARKSFSSPDRPFYLTKYFLAAKLTNKFRQFRSLLPMLSAYYLKTTERK
jgi:hypothetical protein